jgi:signal transduction histidine kinase
LIAWDVEGYVQQQTETAGSDERQIIGDVDRQRGLLLARAVGFTFGIAAAIFVLGMVAAGFAGVFVVTAGTIARFVALLIAIALFLSAAWLTLHGHDVLPGGMIIAGALAGVATFQITREQVHGIDAVVVASFAVYIIFMGLSGVLLTRPLLFGAAFVETVLTVLICFVLPGHDSLNQIDAVVTAIIAGTMQWLAAVLYFFAALFYDQTLAELGNIRLAFDRAQKLDALKNLFISNVNHELRNPVMALYSYVDILREMDEDITPEKRRDLLDKSLGVGDRIIYLITSILDTQQFDQKKIEFTHTGVNIRKTLDIALDLIDPREAKMVERPLYVTISDDLAIWGDEGLLQQILTNLLTNAVKYSPPGSRIEVCASPVPVPATAGGKRDGQAAEHPMVEITIRDYGLGIPMDQADLLFQRFARLQRDLESTIVGNGLGLYLCRAFAEAMDGRIWIESAGVAGEGTTFHLQLPAPSSGKYM